MSLRELLFDTLIFDSFDAYYGEYVLRESVSVLTGLIGEMLGKEMLQTRAAPGEAVPTSPSAMRYYAPVNAKSLDPDSQRTPTLLLSETLLACVMFVEHAQANVFFRTLYVIAQDNDTPTFRCRVTELLTNHASARWLGVNLNTLYGEQRLPSQVEVYALSGEINACLMSKFTPSPLN